MLPNAYLLAKFRFDTAENERNFAEKMQFFRREPGLGREGEKTVSGPGAAPPTPLGRSVLGRIGADRSAPTLISKALAKMQTKRLLTFTYNFLESFVSSRCRVSDRL